MKTQYYTATSINGYIADAQNSLDWLMQFGEIESMKDHYPHFIKDVGAMAMGSTTYEWVIRHDNMLEHPEKWPYEIPAWVFSRRTLPAIPGKDIRFVQGDVAPVHAAMAEAAGGKNIWLVGGGELVGQFHDQGLLDELIITIASVMLEGGAPLLPRRLATPPLRLVGTEQHGDAFAVLTYAVRR
ncbi:MAG: dihydrofolate reductase family protein [Rhodothermales bacterium]